MATNYDLNNTGPEVQERLDQVFPNQEAISTEEQNRADADAAMREEMKAYTDAEKDRAQGAETALVLQDGHGLIAACKVQAHLLCNIGRRRRCHVGGIGHNAVDLLLTGNSQDLVHICCAAGIAFVRQSKAFTCGISIKCNAEMPHLFYFIDYKGLKKRCA